MSEIDALLFANEAFYQAFANRDIEAMDEVWARDLPVACLHPGWPPLEGRDAVMQSWLSILANPQAPPIRCHDARGHLLGETRYLAAAEATVHAGWNGIKQYPHAHTALLDALEELLYPPQTIVIRGGHEPMREWQERAQRHYAPRRISIAIPADEPGLPGLLAAREPRGEITAYVCQGHQCDAPMQDREAFERALATHEVARSTR